jgi:hypothetical protein
MDDGLRFLIDVQATCPSAQSRAFLSQRARFGSNHDVCGRVQNLHRAMQVIGSDEGARVPVQNLYGATQLIGPDGARVWLCAKLAQRNASHSCCRFAHANLARPALDCRWLTRPCRGPVFFGRNMLKLLFNWLLLSVVASIPIATIAAALVTYGHEPPI